MALLRNVLVADDEASIRHVLSLVLQSQGFEVRAVSNGEDALAELETRDYDAVISDVRMPKLDGLTLLKRALERVVRLSKPPASRVTHLGDIATSPQGGLYAMPSLCGSA